ncbi:hypothetical protein NPIL_185151 [Nephila pilipes]|uniref:Uncharacterized protein n=1 Tax=Nephila pilipes TaxID=299642 RepID=A0A8X6UF03_NEPPI|nr:hypothetical protein NPIL_185151 [Nephila pilipes]
MDSSSVGPDSPLDLLPTRQENALATDHESLEEIYLKCSILIPSPQEVGCAVTDVYPMDLVKAIVARLLEIAIRTLLCALDCLRDLRPDRLRI